MRLKNIAYSFIALAGLCGVLSFTPAVTYAQSTIRNITILAMPADATELPTAIAAAENVANPTAPFVLSANMCFDGSTWDRCATSTGGAGAVDANTGRVTLGSDDPAVTALQIIDNVETGATAASVVSAASNNFTTVKASAGRLTGVNLVNTTGTLYYIRFYNDAAMVTGDCASATNLVFHLPIPASTTGAGFSVNFGQSGIAFSTGIGYCIVAGASTSDNTSAATGVIGVLAYK